ncbi:MAG: hypothetical protein L0Y78_09675 [candidate division NC10 bacterium]|nr:hypothetical protein [candidate division NC10 bacterium]
MRQILLIVCLFLLLPISLAYAQAVPIEVQVIQASREPSSAVDPAIGQLVRELQRDFAYTNYRLLETHRGEVSPQSPWRTVIAGGRDLSVALMKMDKGRVELHITTPRVNTRVSLQRGGRPILLGGPPHGSGVLIMVISAR